MPSYRYKYVRNLVNNTIKFKKTMLELADNPIIVHMGGFMDPKNKDEKIKKIDLLIADCYRILSDPKRFKKL